MTTALRAGILATSHRLGGRNMKVHRKSTVAAVTALALLPASALAATIAGGPGGERLRGTNGPDVIDGNGGNDPILGLRGDDRLLRGPGHDPINGGARQHNPPPRPGERTPPRRPPR